MRQAIVGNTFSSFMEWLVLVSHEAQNFSYINSITSILFIYIYFE